MKTQGQFSPVLHKMSIVTTVRQTSDLQYDQCPTDSTTNIVTSVRPSSMRKYDEYGENEPPIEP